MSASDESYLAQIAALTEERDLYRDMPVKHCGRDCPTCSPANPASWQAVVTGSGAVEYMLKPGTYVGNNHYYYGPLPPSQPRSITYWKGRAHAHRAMVAETMPSAVESAPPAKPRGLTVYCQGDWEP